jgi:UDP-N-acetyl-D-galactosamine dehydrogenase
VFTPLEVLLQADALIAAVLHRQYRDMPIDDLQSKLQPAEIFVDAKSVYA